jgi:hypothetical protein
VKESLNDFSRLFFIKRREPVRAFSRRLLQASGERRDWRRPYSHVTFGPCSSPALERRFPKNAIANRNVGRCLRSLN